VRHPEYHEACKAAMNENGKRLLTVCCREHGEKVGEIRTSSFGDVFVSKKFEPRADYILKAPKGTFTRQRAPWFNLVYLFGHPLAPAAVTAWCRGCGDGTLDQAKLLEALLHARKGGDRKHLVVLRRGATIPGT
jgi:hypothetical protein